MARIADGNGRIGPPAGRIGGGLPIRGLYVHVPFCTEKCAYCSFYSRAVGSGPPPFGPVLEALRGEARFLQDRLDPRTLYIGGGTPTCLSPGDLHRLLSWMRSLCPEPPEEWTVEANPETTDPARARILARAGVTRVSIGAQSFDPAVLRFLGRRHDARDIVQAVETLRAEGDFSISLDLIAAVPAGNRRGWERTLQRALDLNPDHLSVYCLSWEPGTPLTDLLRRGRIERPTEDLERALFDAACRRLERAGYRRYEISNFARPGRACRHNLDCWRLEPYLGLGPSASSFVDGRRWTNVADVDAYVAGVRRGTGVRAVVEAPSARRLALEAAAFGLRTARGWTRRGFREKTGADWDSLWGERVRELREAGYLRRDPDRLALTRRGMNLADAVVRRLVGID